MYDPPSPGTLPPPVVLAFLVCEGVSLDEQTGQLTLHKLLSTLRPLRTPVTISGICTYAAVTSGRSVERFMLRIVDVDGARAPVTESGGDLDMDGPLAVGELVMTTEDIVFPQPGEYRVQLLARGMLLVERRLTVELAAPVGEMA